MSRPKPNVAHLQQLIRVLQPQDRMLDMTSFHTCAIGLLARDPWMIERGWKWTESGILPAYKGSTRVFTGTREFFGLSHKESCRLFGMRDWAVPNSVPSEVVISRIHHIIDAHSGPLGAVKRWLGLLP